MNRKLFFGFIIAYFNVLHWETFLQADSFPYFSEVEDPNGSYQFFENQYYKFTTTSRNLFISDQVNSDANLSEVFPSKHVSSDEYILFNATHGSPRLNYYFDPDDLDFNGSIQVIPYLEEGPIIPTSLASEDYFGYELVINDWNETIVSSPSKNSNSGSIYVFEHNASNQFIQKSQLLPESGDEGWWGDSLEVSGDLLFIGAPNAALNAGKVLLYQRINGIYTKQAELSDPRTGITEFFGSSISFGANQEKLIISPNVEGSDRAGRVEIFDLDALGNLTHDQTLWSDDNVSGNYFGIDHALTEEYLIVGAPKEDNQYGRAYIFDRENNGSWSNSPTSLVPSSLSANDEFGYTVEINENFAFVGARVGDGNVTDSGAVYIFNKQNESWVETAKLFPPSGDSNQIFSVSLEALDDLIVVGSIGVGSEGMAYVYKMHEGNASDWRLISALDNNGSSTTNRNYLSIAVQKGIIAIGSPEDSVNLTDGGSFKVFYNEGWQLQNPMPLDPLFTSVPSATLDILEDSLSGASYDFEVEHPFENNFTWNISSDNAPANTFSVSSEGNFSYLPEGNFSGVKNFTIGVSSLNGGRNHSFQVNIISQPDSPIFDAGQSNELQAVWVGEDTDQTIQVYDSDDNDTLTITANSLPDGLLIVGHSIQGRITDDSLLNGASYRDFQLELVVSDGVPATDDATKFFNLRVYSRNSAPFFTDENGTPVTTKDITLNEDFTVADWAQAFGQLRFQDDYTESGFTLTLETNASHGVVYLDVLSSTPIVFLPDENYFGTDVFSVALHDDNNPSKSFVLPVNVTINPVNDAPVLSSAIQVQASEGIPFSYDISWVDVDHDSGHVVTITDLPGWITYDDTNYRIQGTPEWEDYRSDPYKVFILIEDPAGGSGYATIEIDIIPLNYPPKFNQDNLSLSIPEDTQLTIPLSAFDQDLIDGLVTWSFVTEPLHGTFSLSANNYQSVVEYQPEGNYTGADFLEIKIYDPLHPHLFDLLEVDIFLQSVEDPPVIFPRAKYTDAVVGHEWNFEYAWQDGDINQTVQIIPPTLPSWLTFQGNIDSNASRARIFGVPSSSDLGITSITLEASDSTELVGNETFEINVLAENFVPEIVEGENLSVELVEDGFWEKVNALTSYDQNKQRQQWTVLSGPQNGVVQLTEENENLKTIRYSPGSNFNGDDSVVIQLSDGIDSDQFTYYFKVISVDDAPFFTSNQEGDTFRVEDGELFEQEITFFDGDMDLSHYTTTDLPAWVSLDASNFANGILHLSGRPSVADEGNYQVTINIFDEKNLSSTLSFNLEAYVYNYPPVLTLSEPHLEFDEDQSKVRLGVLSVTDRDQASGHNWSIPLQPRNGIAIFTLLGNERVLYYLPDGNFSGVDELTLAVSDNGTALGDSKSESRNIQITVNPIPDSPIFVSVPTEQAYSDEDYIYNIKAKDGDLPIDELKIELVSAPPWLTFQDHGDGTGVLSGKATYKDEGLFEVHFKVEDLNGDDDEQSFLLDVTVLDYPPQFRSKKTDTILEKVILYVNEDQLLDKWINPRDFYAYNPDPEPDDYKEIRWYVEKDSQQGSELQVSGSGDKPTLFKYKPRSNFNGTDYFSLVMDEGDLKTELPFEVQVTPVADPPSFSSNIQSLYLVNQGEPFELPIYAEDIDSTRIQFRLLGPTWDENPWLNVEDYNSSGSVVLRGIPQVAPNGNIYQYSIVAMDENGLLAEKGFSVEVQGINSPPSIISEEIEILFDPDGAPISDIASLRAYDPDGDALTWSLLGEDKEPVWGTAFVEGNGSTPSRLSYVAKSLKASQDKFWLKVSDGVGSDTILVRPIIAWGTGLSVVGEFTDFSIKEMQGFSKDISFFPNNSLDEITFHLKEGPSWIAVNQISKNKFRVRGVAPQGSSANYHISLEAKGEVTAPYGVDFNLEVQSSVPPTLELKDNLLVRLSSFEPFDDQNFRASDANGKDLSSDVLIEEKDGTGFKGFKTLEYTVSDQFDNFASETLLVRQYFECPLLVDTKRLKFNSKNLLASWANDGKMQICADQFQITEVNGTVGFFPPVDGSSSHLISRNLAVMNSLEFKGSNVSVSELLNDGRNTFISGYFSEHITFGFNSIYSEFPNNAFVGSFDQNGNVIWVKSFGSSNPIESLKLSFSGEGKLVMGGAFYESLTFRGPNDLHMVERNKGVFLFEFEEDGLLTKSISYEINSAASVAGVASDRENTYLIGNNWEGNEGLDSRVLLMGSDLEILNEVSLQSTKNVNLVDFEIVNGHCVVAGNFEGTLSLGGNNLLTGSSPSAFLICLDDQSNATWAKVISSSEASNIHALESDYWGDLLVGVSFSGSIETGIGAVASAGFDDLLLVNYKLSDASPLWFKSIGGVGEERFHSLKTGTMGTPLLHFETQEGLFMDGYDFSPTTHNEVHSVRFVSKSGIPEIELNEIMISEIGDFSFGLEVVYPEYLFFEKVSGPDWVNIKTKDGSLGRASIIGNSKYASLSEINAENILKVRVFTIDGTYSEKNITITFSNDDGFDIQAGALPKKNEDLSFHFENNTEISCISPDLNGGWVLAGLFPELVDDDPPLFKSSSQLALLSDSMELSLLCSFYSSDKLNVSDIKYIQDNSILAYGTFSGILKFKDIELTSAGLKDLFLMRISADGELIDYTTFGSVYSEESGEMILNEKGDVLISGSFQDQIIIGVESLMSSGQEDGFIASLSINEFMKVNWAENYGFTGIDHIDSICRISDDQFIAASISSTDTTDSEFSPSFQPISRLDLRLIDGGDGLTKDIFTFYSNGRINNAKVVSALSLSGRVVCAFEFEGKLEWPEGEIRSKGGFDIFSTSLGASFANPVNFSLLGGMWNDRLSDLQSMNEDYYISSTFYNSMKLGDKFINSVGSSDAVLVKVDSVSHEILDFFHLSSPVPDAIKFVYPISDEFILLGGSTEAVKPLMQNDEAFISFLGSKVTEPRVLSSVPFALPLSYPFSFTIKTGPWPLAVTELKLVDYDEELAYDWIQYQIDDSGNLRFYGISPSFEQVFPFEFAIASATGDYSLPIQFNLSISDDGSHVPVIEVEPEIKMTSGEIYESRISFYDLDLEQLSVFVQGPEWIELKNSQKGEADLIIDGTNQSGVFEFLTVVTDTKGNTSEQVSKVIISSIDNDLNEEGIPSSSGIFDSWLLNKVSFSSGWHYHLEFDWVYIKQDEDGSTWLWKEGWGWLWSENKLWNDDGEGYFYKDASSSWIFWKPQVSDLDNNVYDFEAEQWMQL